MVHYIVFSALIIGGLIIIIIQQKIGANHTLYPYLSQAASALLVGGILSILYKIFVDKQSESRLKKLLHIHDSILNSGLREIHTNYKTFSFSSLIKSSKTLRIVINDGRTWASTNSPELEVRFSTRGSQTDFFLVDPDGAFIHALAHKTKVPVNQLKEKIGQTISIILDTYEKSSRQGDLRIYAMSNYPTNAIFLSENEVVLTPYQISSGRSNVPLYIYECSGNIESRFNDIVDDVNSLALESRIVMDSAKPQDNKNNK